MKKTLLAIMAALACAACEKDNTILSQSEDSFIVRGYSNLNGTKTSFGTPTDDDIPYSWSEGDYIWLGENKSSALTNECEVAQFEFKGGTAVVGTGHVFFNMTGTAKSAKVLAVQSADGNLGNDGDFGYATLDEYNAFYLEHKTSYVWFDTKPTTMICQSSFLLHFLLRGQLLLVIVFTILQITGGITQQLMVASQLL